jgi:hypothetical protein
MSSVGVSLEPTPEIVTGTMRMTEDRLLVKPLDWSGEDVHGTGTQLIVVRDGRPVRGEVVAAGPGIYPIVRREKSPDGRNTKITRSKHFRPTQVKPGDKIEVGGLNVYDGKGYQFPQVVYNGEPHFICTERDVSGVWVE